MTRTVAGLYEDFTRARQAVTRLVENGFERGAIGLMASGINGMYDHYLKEAQPAQDTPEPESGLAAYNVPGIGSVVGMGSVVMAAEENGAGILHALVQAGIPQADAEIYIEGIRRGGTLVIVLSGDERAEEAVTLLNQFHPVNHQQISGLWRKQDWQGFEGNAEPFPFEGNHEAPLRSAESELDYGMGATTFLAGKPVSDYDRSEADMANYVNRDDNDWVMAESGFVDDLKENYAEPGHEKDKLETATQFGYNSSYDPRFTGMDWDGASGALRKIWEMDYPAWPWDDFKNAIHKGWSEGRP